MSAGQGGLDVGNAVLVRCEEVVVPLVGLLGLREEGFQGRVDGFGDFGCEGLLGAVQGFSEAEGLDVDGWVRRIDGMGGGETPLCKGEFVYGNVG